MTDKEETKYEILIHQLCDDLNVRYPLSIHESEKTTAYILRGVCGNEKFTYKDNIRLPKRVLYKMKSIKDVRKETKEYILYIPRRTIDALYDIEEFNLASFADERLRCLIHELTHVYYCVNNHGKRFNLYMNKMIAKGLQIYYAKHREGEHISLKAAMKYLYANPKYKNIICKPMNKKHSKIKKCNPVGYYNVSYATIKLNKSIYDGVNDSVRKFNNKYNKSKYIGCKR